MWDRELKWVSFLNCCEYFSHAARFSEFDGNILIILAASHILFFVNFFQEKKVISRKYSK